MFSVSEAYLEQMMKKGTRRRLSGMIGTIPFSSSDVILNSFNISGRATEESDTKIGGVYLGEMEMTLKPSFLEKIPRDEYKGKEVSVSIGLLVDDGINDAEWVDIPCGVYTLQTPKISKQGISVSGYDHMKKLDKKFDIDQTFGTIWNYLNYVSQSCDVGLGNTQEEIESLPNGLEILSLHENNDVETFRDLVYWLAQTAGCFACADREGNIALKKFGLETDIIFDSQHRDNDVVFSGYVTKWTGVSFIDIDTQMTRYYGLQVDDGLTMNLGANPLLQLGSADAVQRRRVAVLNAVSQIRYTPFSMGSARDPIFDLGDEINFQGGLSGDCVGCVMAYSYNLDGFYFEGFGDEPDLANARSKTDKNISGLIQQTSENEVTYYNFANVEEISLVSERETEIASMAFTSAQKTTVKILHEFIFDMIADLSSDCGYEIRYYLDEELLDYKPYEQVGGFQNVSSGQTDFSITRDFFYVIKDVEPNLRHTWRVTIITHGINTTTIGENHAHVTVEGQRMYGEDYFNGYIVVREDFTIIPMGYLETVSITENVDLIFYATAGCSASDNILLYSEDGIKILNLTEGEGSLSPHIFFETEYGHILTDEGDYLTTENGDRLIL